MTITFQLRQAAVARLEERLPGRVVEAIAAAVLILVEVYERNRREHEPESGDDAMSLAVRNWRNWWNLIEERLSEMPGVGVSWPRGSLQAETEGFILHFWAGEEAVAMRFDTGLTKPQVVQENAAQMTLWSEGTEDALRHVVVVHEGDAHGLRAVLVGAPKDLGLVGEPWHWYEYVYRGEATAEGDFVPPRPTTVTYEAQPVPEPVVSLREAASVLEDIE